MRCSKTAGYTKKHQVDLIQPFILGSVPHRLQAQQAPVLPYAKEVGCPPRHCELPSTITRHENGYSTSSVKIIISLNKIIVISCRKTVFNCQFHPFIHVSSFYLSFCQGSRCPAPNAPNAQKNFIWPDFFSFGANVWRILFSPPFYFFLCYKRYELRKRLMTPNKQCR